MSTDATLNAALEAAGWSEDLLLSALLLPSSPSASASAAAPPPPCGPSSTAQGSSINDDNLLALLDGVGDIEAALGKVDLSGFYENESDGAVARSEITRREPNISSNPSASIPICSIQHMYTGGTDKKKHPYAQTTCDSVCASNPAIKVATEESNDSKLIATAELDGTLSNGYSLFSHQKEAVIKCIENKRTILAFDMGLGKTLISLVWAKAFCRTYPSCMLVVVAPCTLMENWKREAAIIGFEVPSERSGDNSSLNMVLCSWAKIGTAEELLRRGKRDRFVLVCDEAHAMQSVRSIRTQATLALCKHSRCVGCILATGTPMKNGRPANLFPLLTGIRHPVAANKTNFEKRYCDAKKTKFCAWDISGASNLEELRSVIGYFLLRKTKEECLDIAKMCRVKIRALLAPEVHAAYEGIVQRMKGKGAPSVRDIMASRRAAAAGSTSSSSAASHCCLEALTELRRLMSTAKTRYTVQFVRELLDTNPSPVVVFVIFRETVQLLLDALRRAPALRCDCITGELADHRQRQAVVDQFQLGNLDVLVCTYGVGATGLTLTRSHRVVLLDRPWTPGDVMQAEDRIRRIGQVAPEVFSYWICGFPFDDKLDSMLQRKNKRSTKVIEAAETKGGIEFAKSLADGTKPPKGRNGSSSSSLSDENTDPRCHGQAGVSDTWYCG